MDARMRALHRQFTCRDTWYQKKMHCRCRARYTCTCRGRHRHPQKKATSSCLAKKAIWSCMSPSKGYLVMHVSPKRLLGHACLPKKATWSCMSHQKGCLVMHVSPKGASSQALIPHWTYLVPCVPELRANTHSSNPLDCCQGAQSPRLAPLPVLWV